MDTRQGTDTDPVWKIYNPSSADAEAKVKLPPPPPWRSPGSSRLDVIAENFRAPDAVVQAVNVALHLRRPLLVTGKPGTGKSSLIHAVARKLKLGKVLNWNINSRSTLAEGLYRYDALARLQDIQQQRAEQAADAPRDGAKNEGDELGRFITLGALGTALAAKDDAPRALLIDEIDKSDVDLPNDLLAVLDHGSFPIVELQRIVGKHEPAQVLTVEAEKVSVEGGVVEFSEYPFIVMTSNGERDFPAAFLRRCVQCTLEEPDKEQLKDILNAHLKALASDPDMDKLIGEFIKRRSQSAMANDQLLNAHYLAEHRRNFDNDDERKDVLEALFRSLEG